MQILRTPEERFEGLAGYPFHPDYTAITDADGTLLRVHAVDEGAGAPVLLLHGEPTWSYLYRRFVDPLVARGHRVVAPDLVGFGKSDKPAGLEDYTYERHVAWLSAWLLAKDLRDITLFCQDWGGLVGLRLVAAFPDRFARVIAANTALPVGKGMSDGFQAWLDFSQNVPEFPVGRIVRGGCAKGLGDAEVAAYDAPFPEERYKVAARRFPTLVPVTPEHASVAENRAAWEQLARFERPFLTAFSDGDPLTRGSERPMQQRIPGAMGREHVVIQGGGHFLQEDCAAECVQVIDGFIRGTIGSR